MTAMRVTPASAPRPWLTADTAPNESVVVMTAAINRGRICGRSWTLGWRLSTVAHREGRTHQVRGGGHPGRSYPNSTTEATENTETPDSGCTGIDPVSYT